MWKKLYSNSGLILLAILAAGIWFSNVMSFFPVKSAPEYANFDAAPVASPALTSMPEDEIDKFLKRQPRQITIEEALSSTARCKDGTLSYSRSRRGTCSHHGGVAQWFSQ